MQQWPPRPLRHPGSARSIIYISIIIIICSIIRILRSSTGRRSIGRRLPPFFLAGKGPACGLRLPSEKKRAAANSARGLCWPSVKSARFGPPFSLGSRALKTGGAPRAALIPPPTTAPLNTYLGCICTKPGRQREFLAPRVTYSGPVYPMVCFSAFQANVAPSPASAL